MPKETYYNLGEEKRKKIYDVLVDEFKTHSINESTVKSIVDKLHIPRGSFYQYFDSLNESYFYVLEKEVRDLHSLLANLLNKYNDDLQRGFSLFGEEIINELFDENKYHLYKNRYLYFDASLEEQWKEYYLKNINQKDDYPLIFEKEKLKYISSIVHSLIKRLFSEGWNKEEFLKQYNLYISWIMKGVN